MGDPDVVDEMSDDERAAVEEMERGLEWFHRAHGELVAFHHAVGRAMEHFDATEQHLRGGHDDIADRIEEEILPAGVTADGKLTYEVVAEFEDGLTKTIESTANRTFEELADGRRYAVKRAKRGESPNE